MSSSLVHPNVDQNGQMNKVMDEKFEHLSRHPQTSSSSSSVSSSSSSTSDDLPSSPPSYEHLIEQIRQNHLQSEEFCQLDANSDRIRHCLRNDLIRHRLQRYLNSCDRSRSSFKCDNQCSRLRAEAIRLQSNRNQNHLALRVLYKALQFVSLPACLRNDFDAEVKPKVDESDDQKSADNQKPKHTRPNSSPTEDQHGEKTNSEFAQLLNSICGSLFTLGRYSQCVATLDLLLKLPTTASDRVDYLLQKAACVRLQGDTATSNQLLAQCLSLIDSQPLPADLDQRLQRKRGLLLDYQRKVGLPRNVAETAAASHLTPLDLFDREQQQISSRLRTMHQDLKWHPQVREMHSQGKGRGLFVTGNVAHDQILLQETPTASLARTESSETVCCYCLRDLHGPKQVQLPVPCLHCTDVLFCSFDCQTTAWQQFHWLECGHEHWLNESGSARLAMRMVTSGLGWQESVRAYNQRRSSSFPQLMSHSENFPVEVRARQTLAAVLFSQFLLQKQPKPILSHRLPSNVVDQNHTKSNQPDLISDCSRVSNQEQLLSELILLHLQQVAVNSVAIHRPALQPLNLRCPVPLPPSAPLTPAECERLLMLGQRVDQIGLSFYPSTSILNHSCVPNADLFFFDGHRLQVRSRRELRAGEEITISYGPLFSRQSRRTRRASLIKSHYFVCECEACQWTETATNSKTATTITIAAITAGLESVDLTSKRNSLSRLSIRKKSKSGSLSRNMLSSSSTNTLLSTTVTTASKLSLDPLRFELADAFLCPLCDHPLLVDFENKSARCLNPMQSHQTFNVSRLAQEFSDAQHRWLQAAKGEINGDRRVNQVNILQPLQCLLWPQNRMLLGAQLEAAKHALACGNELEALRYLDVVRAANRTLFGEQSAEYLHSVLDQLLIRCKLALDQQLASGQQLSKAMKQANAQWRKIADGAVRPHPTTPTAAASNMQSFRFKLSPELRQQLQTTLQQFWMLLLSKYVLMPQSDGRNPTLKVSAYRPTGYLLLDGGAINNCLLAYRQILRYWPG